MAILVSLFVQQLSYIRSLLRPSLSLSLSFLKFANIQLLIGGLAEASTKIIYIFFMINLQVMFERIRVENEERKGQESSRVEPGKEGEPTTGASDPQVMGRLDQETVNNQILELNEMLKKLNAYSSFLNILTLMVLKLHLVYLAHRLYMTC